MENSERRKEKGKAVRIRGTTGWQGILHPNPAEVRTGLPLPYHHPARETCLDRLIPLPGWREILITTQSEPLASGVSGPANTAQPAEAHLLPASLETPCPHWQMLDSQLGSIGKDGRQGSCHKGLVTNSVCPGANLRLLFPQRGPGRTEVLAQRKYHTWPGKAHHLHGPEKIAPPRDTAVSSVGRGNLSKASGLGSLLFSSEHRHQDVQPVHSVPEGSTSRHQWWLQQSHKPGRLK